MRRDAECPRADERNVGKRLSVRLDARRANRDGFRSVERAQPRLDCDGRCAIEARRFLQRPDGKRKLRPVSDMAQAGRRQRLGEECALCLFVVGRRIPRSCGWRRVPLQQQFRRRKRRRPRRAPRRQRRARRDDVLYRRAGPCRTSEPVLSDVRRVHECACAGGRLHRHLPRCNQEPQHVRERRLARDRRFRPRRIRLSPW